MCFIRQAVNSEESFRRVNSEESIRNGKKKKPQGYNVELIKVNAISACSIATGCSDKHISTRKIKNKLIHQNTNATFV